jgi:hypothetical protein
MALLLSLGLQGCQEEMEICVMKSFPTAENNKNDLALGGFTGWRESTERMPQQCCQALRTYITYMHEVKKNPKTDDPRTEVINEAMKEADQKTIEQRASENPNDAKVKEAQAANAADAKRNAEQGKGGDPADPNTVTETQHTASADRQVEEIREEDGMKKLTWQLEAAFCPMECPRKVVGDSELKKALATLCQPAAASLFEQSQPDWSRSARVTSPASVGSSLRATSFIQEAVFDSSTGAEIASYPRMAEPRKAAAVTPHGAASISLP